MIQVYKILDNIRDHFRNNDITETVTFGDALNIEMDKTTVFPLAHFDISSAQYDAGVIVFTVSVLALDNVNVSKDVDSQDDFFGSSDLQDVYNTQFVVMTKFINSLKRGDLQGGDLHLFEEPEVFPFENRFEGMLAGWIGEVKIMVQNDISGC
jgi:hypothetical protein